MTQAAFTTALLDPGTPAPAGLSDPDGNPAGRRFDVYRNNVTVGLIDALETAFPAVRSLVGENNFRILARDHARAHPPASPLMMHYGAEMPGFLAGYAAVAQLRYLPDVARLELALRRSYHAADAAPLAPETIATIAPGDLSARRLILAPAVQALASPWPLHAIWTFALDRSAPKPSATPQDVLILRPDYDPVALAMPPGTAQFAAALAGGATLGGAVDAAAFAAEGFDPAPALSALIVHGGITRTETET